MLSSNKLPRVVLTAITMMVLIGIVVTAFIASDLSPYHVRAQGMPPSEETSRQQPIASGTGESQAATWVLQNTGLNGNEVNAFIQASGGTIPVLAGTEANGVYRLEGQTWVQSGLVGKAVIAFAKDGATTYAGTSTGVARSTTQGQSWESFNNTISSLRIVSLATVGSILFAASSTDRVYRSSDQAQTWTDVSAGLPQPSNVYLLLTSLNSQIYVSFSRDDALNGPENKVYRADESGQGWTLAWTPPRKLLSLRANCCDLYAGLSADGLYRSSDGVNWTESLIYERPVSIDAAGGHIFAAMLFSGFFYSNTSGGSWRRANDGLPVGATFLPRAIGTASLTRVYLALTEGRVYALDAQPGFPALSSDRTAVVSAATFNGDALAGQSIAAAFGTNLATATIPASTLPLPTELGGTTVRIVLLNGIERLAPLFYVSPGQVNLQLPADIVNGTVDVIITNSSGARSFGVISVVNVMPGIFTSGSFAAAQVFRLRADGSQTYEPVAQHNGTTFVSVPIDFGPATDQLVLILYGTGIRFRSSLAGVTALIGGTSAPVHYAGPQGTFVGLDQINVPLSRSFAGRGLVDVQLSVDGKIANIVKVTFK